MERINPRPRRVFYDLEFLEDGRTIEPISIGLCAERSTEAFYGINADAPWGRIVRHRFLVDEVLPHLPGELELLPTGRYEGEPLARFVLDRNDERVYSRRDLSGAVRGWLEGQAQAAADATMARDADPVIVNRTDLELWAHFGAYDHVALCQLVGGCMVDLPPFVPMCTHDLRVLADTVGLHGIPLDQVVAQAPGSAHDALSDAMWNLLAFDELRDRWRRIFGRAEGTPAGNIVNPGPTGKRRAYVEPGELAELDLVDDDRRPVETVEPSRADGWPL